MARAIRSGIFNDLGSGSNVDVSVITKSGTEMLRNYEMPVSYLERYQSWNEADCAERAGCQISRLQIPTGHNSLDKRERPRSGRQYRD